MYVLWARKRDGADFEYICAFDKVEEKYYRIGELDEDVYKEAIVVSEDGCELYVEFKEKQWTKKK